MVFEKRHQPLATRSVFLWRFLKFASIAFALIFLSLGGGILGYKYLEGMAWVDSFLNAAMIMGGMGPVGEMHRDAGKIFAGLYALYCGFILLVSAGILITPLLHRLLHHFHVENHKEP